MQGQQLHHSSTVLRLLQLLLLLQLLRDGDGIRHSLSVNSSSSTTTTSIPDTTKASTSAPDSAPAIAREALTSRPQASAYAVIIDAGSSGSRVHVFRYLPPTATHSHTSASAGIRAIPTASAHLEPNSNTHGSGYAGHYARVELPGSQMRIGPGLSSYAPYGMGAGESLKPLLEFAKQKVPRVLWHHTPIHVMATAGLRMLPRNQTAAILDNCRAVLAASGFAFKPSWARVLSGAEEGLFAWVAVNYAAGTLQALALANGTAAGSTATTSQGIGQRQGSSTGASAQGTFHNHDHAVLQPHTYGVFELGGASMQVTFQLPASTADTLAAQPWLTHTHSLPLPGLHGVRIFSQSLLGFGMDTALARVSHLMQHAGATSDPCMLRGSTSSLGLPGEGSFLGCLNHAQQLLPKSGIATQPAARAVLGSSARSITDAGASKRAVVGGSGQEAASAIGTFDDDNSDHSVAFNSRRIVEAPAGGDSVDGATAGQAAPCSLPGCGFDSASLPPITGLHFAMENFFHTAQRLQLPVQPTLLELIAAGTAFCNKTWSEAEEQYVKGRDEPRKYVATTCFGAAFIVTMLRDALRIAPHERRLIFTDSVRRPIPGAEDQGSGEAGGAGVRHAGGEEPETVEVNWPLGAMLMEVAHGSHSTHSVGHQAHAQAHQRHHQHHVQPTRGEAVRLRMEPGGSATLPWPQASAAAGPGAAAGQVLAMARLRAGAHVTRPRQRPKSSKQHGQKGTRHTPDRSVGPGAAAGVTGADAVLSGDEEGASSEGQRSSVGFVGHPFGMALLLLLAVGAAAAVSMPRGPAAAAAAPAPFALPVALQVPGEGLGNMGGQGTLVSVDVAPGFPARASGLVQQIAVSGLQATGDPQDVVSVPLPGTATSQWQC